jgi:hypothetical protein
MSSSPIVDLVAKAGPEGLETNDLCRHFRCAPQEIGDEIERLKEAGDILGFAGTWVVPDFLPILETRMTKALSDLHALNPTQPLFDPVAIANQAELRWGSKPSARLLTRLSEGGAVRGRNGRFGLTGSPIELKTATRVLLDKIKTELDRVPIGAANPEALTRELRLPPQAIDEILEIGANVGEIREIAPELWITKERLAATLAQVKAHFGGEEPTVAQVRDHLGSSRRIAHALLESSGDE